MPIWNSRGVGIVVFKLDMLSTVFYVGPIFHLGGTGVAELYPSTVLFPSTLPLKDKALIKLGSTRPRSPVVPSSPFQLLWAELVLNT